MRIKKNNSLEQVSYVLSELLEIPVKFIKETRSEELINSTFENRVTLMENTRYEDLPNKCESGCDDELAKYWSSAGEIFIMMLLEQRTDAILQIMEYLNTYLVLMDF